MPYLLYDLITKEDPDREPILALHSAVHWMQALTFEVDRQFPEPTSTQYAACNAFLQQARQTGIGTVNRARVYEPLFHSLLNAMSLSSITEACPGQPWIYGNAIVWWYYAYYHAFRSMLAAHGHQDTKTHASLIKAITPTLGKRLPPPLNMEATHVLNEDYRSALPGLPGVAKADLLVGPVDTAATAQGMLISYLSGTAKWLCDNVKDQIRRERHDITTFRSRQARELRNSRLPHHVNFMNCAYRYRTKANYRDPLFLPYGKRELVSTEDFLEDLAKTARFAFVFGVAYVERRLGVRLVRELMTDLRENMRGQERGSGRTHFWRDIPL